MEGSRMKRHVRRVTPSRRPRRRSRSPWALMLSSALAASAVKAQPATAAPLSNAGDGGAQVVGAAAADTRVLQFTIPAGLLEDAIAEFQRITGLRVTLANPGIAMIQSPGAAGAMTPARAMEALLAGTSVRATFGSGVVNLDIRPESEFVAVEGEAPTLQSPKYAEPLRDTPQTV